MDWNVQRTTIAAFEEVSVAQALQRCREARIRLPAEIGAYIALDLAESLLERPVSFSASEVFLQSEGVLWIERTAPACTPVAAAMCLQQLLVPLLVAAGPEPLHDLLDVVDRANAVPLDLRALRDALEACLLPLNHAASRRVLGRFARQVHMGSVVFALPKQRSVVARPAAHWQSELDGQMDGLLHRDSLLNGDSASAGDETPGSSAPPWFATQSLAASAAAVANPAQIYARRAGFSWALGESLPSAVAEDLHRPRRRGAKWRIAAAFCGGLLLGIGLGSLLWLR